MAQERRAFFGKVDMAGSQPKRVYTLNPAAWQFWVALATLVSFYLASLTFIVGREFDQRLNKFHEYVKPQIMQAIDAKVTAHAALPSHGTVLDEISAVKIRNAAADQRWVDLQKTLGEMKESQAEMNKKMDEILRKVR